MKDFELNIIAEFLEESELKNIDFLTAADNEVVEFSGAGYFLAINNPALPQHRVVLDSPNIQGKLGGIDVGYLAFVESSELILECYSYDQEILPKHRLKGFVRNST